MSPNGRGQVSPPSSEVAGGPRDPAAFWSLPAPNPLLITSPLFVCDAKPAGRGALAVTVSGRDRTGLLWAVCDVARRHDPGATIEAGFGQTVEDYCAIFLLLRDPLDPRRLAGLPDRLRELAAGQVEGWQIPVVARAQLRVRGPDRPGVLHGITAVLKDERSRTNIRRFDSEAYTRFPAAADPLTEAGEPVCVLHFDLELSQEAVNRSEDVRSQIAQLGPDYDSKFTL
jgi:predicted amino acid-binding ACT domain protein